MSDRLKTFVALNRERFDVAEPPIAVWKNIDSGVKLKRFNVGKEVWIKKLKYLGFSASILILAVYIISLKGIFFTNDSGEKNSIPISIQKGIEVQEPILLPSLAKKDTANIKYFDNKIIDKARDSVLFESAKKNFVNNVNPKVTNSHHTKSLPRKHPYADVLIHYPDVIIDSYNSATKSSGEFYPVQPRFEVLLVKNKTPISLCKGSYVIVGFTHKYIIETPALDEIILEAGGLGDADIYVSSDNVEYTYLGVASRGISRLDLEKISYKKQVKYIKIIGKDFKGKSEGYDLINVCASQKVNK